MKWMHIQKSAFDGVKDIFSSFVSALCFQAVGTAWGVQVIISPTLFWFLAETFIGFFV